jgi:glycosyltransferase involved in cell wall biosynthesis
MDISLVIPLLNESESLPELYKWIVKVADNNALSFEILFIDDGSSDRSWEVITGLATTDPRVKGIRFNRNYGKSAALHVGFDRAQGDVVITMDADLQDSPDEIPELYKMIKEGGFDLVSGWKKKRYDPITKTIPTRLYNWATRKMSGIYLHDFNCGLKAYSNQVVKSLEIQGEMHRYIPVIAKREGFSKIAEKVVHHQARKYGQSKFGFERFINGFLDLLTISFLARFGKKPMHLFGTLGILMFTIGAMAFAWIGGSKLYFIAIDVPAKNIAEQSSFFIALTAMILGTQLFLAGFIGELISRTDPKRNAYKVREEI